MCRMCERDDYDSLLELQARSYQLDSVVFASTNSTSPQISFSSHYKTENPPAEEQSRRASLSTCFSNLNIQRTQTTPSSMSSRRGSIISTPPSTSLLLTSSLLSPPSSPKSAALPLMRVMEADECEYDDAKSNNITEGGELDHEPCRRFQRQILSRLQVLGPQFVEQQQQDPLMLMIPSSNSAVPEGESATVNTARFTPPPSPNPYNQRQRKISTTSHLRTSALSSRKGGTSGASQLNRMRLPSLVDLSVGISSSNTMSHKLDKSSRTGNIYGRRVSSPNPSSHLDSRGGVRKLGCGRKSSIEILGENTPFKSGWSFSTAYGRGK